MSTEQRITREIQKRDGVITAQSGKVLRARFPHRMAALNCYDAVLGDVQDAKFSGETDLVIYLP